MQNVPKIVSERLRAAAPVADHPSFGHPGADVLTAFSELALSDRERRVVLDHLARCRDCRDVVALALPATEAVQPVIMPARSGWFAWPALRWGLAAAGLVVVASFGVIEYQRQTREQSAVAKFSEPPEKISTQLQAPLPASTTPTPEPKQDESSRKQAVEKSPVRAVQARAAGAAISKREREEPAFVARDKEQPGNAFHGQAFGAVGGLINNRQIAGGPNMPTQWQQQRPATSGRSALTLPPAGNEQSAAANTPPASQPVRVETIAASPQAASPPVDSSQVQGAQPTQSQSRATSDQTSALVVDDSADLVSKAKPAPPPALRTNGMRAKTPHWAISSTGTLQRSFDQGKTWQDVDVTPKVASAELKGYASKEAVARAKEKDNAADKKVAATAVLAVVFRTVAVNGSDVWAGGSNAALYHSLDAGSEWSQIMPSSDGTTLTGDVISLEFSDAGQGRVRTSSGETWLTTDDGQTWQKR